jgi:hypothetical protein
MNALLLDIGSRLSHCKIQFRKWRSCIPTVARVEQPRRIASLIDYMIAINIWGWRDRIGRSQERRAANAVPDWLFGNTSLPPTQLCSACGRFWPIASISTCFDWEQVEESGGRLL